MTNKETNEYEYKKLIEEDPRRFIETFRESLEYRDAFEDFYVGKSLSEDTTNEEKRQVFEHSQNAREALVDFARLIRGFSYNPSYYSSVANSAIEQYIGHVQMMKNSQANIERVDLESQDLQRSIYHMRLAQVLTEEGITPNERIGRTLGRLILIEKGLDTYDSATEPDIERIRRATP